MIFIIIWQKLNWRGRLARLQAYFNEGRTLIGYLSPTTLGIGLLVLDKYTLSMWWLLVAVPITFIVLFILGYLWKEYGWLRHASEISTIEGWSRLNIFQLNLQIAIAKQLNIDISEINSNTLNKEVLNIMISKEGIK